MSFYLEYESHPSEPSSCNFQTPHFNTATRWKVAYFLVIYFKLHLHWKAALHLSINRGTRSIVTNSAMVEGTHFCEPRGGSTESVVSVVVEGPRASVRNSRRYSDNYPRLGRAYGNGAIRRQIYLLFTRTLAKKHV